MVILADLPAESKAADIGQHDIQNGQIQPLAVYHLQGLGAGETLEHGAALAFQIDLHQVGNLRLVIHHQDIGVHALPSFFRYIIICIRQDRQGTGHIVRKSS